MKFSLNNRLIVEQYIKEGLKAKVSGGIATPGQRDGLKGLKTLIETTLSDGRRIPKGSMAYVREETLHTQQWASKPMTSDAIPEKFIILDLAYVDFIDIPEGTIVPTPTPTSGQTLYETR